MEIDPSIFEDGIIPDLNYNNEYIINSNSEYDNIYIDRPLQGNTNNFFHNNNNIGNNNQNYLFNSKEDNIQNTNENDNMEGDSYYSQAIEDNEDMENENSNNSDRINDYEDVDPNDDPRNINMAPLYPGSSSTNGQHPNGIPLDNLPPTSKNTKNEPQPANNNKPVGPTYPIRHEKQIPFKKVRRFAMFGEPLLNKNPRIKKPSRSFINNNSIVNPNIANGVERTRESDILGHCSSVADKIRKQKDRTDCWLCRYTTEFQQKQGPWQLFWVTFQMNYKRAVCNEEICTRLAKIYKKWVYKPLKLNNQNPHRLTPLEIQNHIESHMLDPRVWIAESIEDLRIFNTILKSNMFTKVQQTDENGYVKDIGSIDIDLRNMKAYEGNIKLMKQLYETDLSKMTTFNNENWNFQLKNRSGVLNVFKNEGK
jgi:hypothetical protein